MLVAGLTAVAIALVTVNVQTVRAAVANPVKALRRGKAPPGLLDMPACGGYSS